MTQKNLLQSAGDGTAVPAGYVGEKISFTEITTTTTIAGTWAVGTTIGSLPAGTWAIYGYFRAGVGSGVTQCQMQLSTSTSGGSGGLLPVNGSIAGTSITYSMNAPLPIAYISTVNATTPLYPQVVTTGAAGNAAIGGFAIRIA